MQCAHRCNSYNPSIRLITLFTLAGLSRKRVALSLAAAALAAKSGRLEFTRPSLLLPAMPDQLWPNHRSASSVCPSVRLSDDDWLLNLLKRGSLDHDDGDDQESKQAVRHTCAQTNSHTHTHIVAIVCLLRHHLSLLPVECGPWRTQ